MMMMMRRRRRRRGRGRAMIIRMMMMKERQENQTTTDDRGSSGGLATARHLRHAASHLHVSHPALPPARLDRTESIARTAASSNLKFCFSK